MRYIIYLTGILIAALFITQEKNAYEHRSALLNSNQAVSTEVVSLNKTLDLLNSFQAHQPQSILSSYRDFLNNVYLIANANGAQVLTKSSDLSADKDIKISSKDSSFSGVSQIDLDITLGDLINFNKLSAIFIALSDLEKSTPIIIHGFYQEKDYLIFKVSVLGV